MATFIKEPAFWRSRALEARAIAARMTDLLSRSAMVSRAARYERLADRAATRRDIFGQSEEPDLLLKG